MVTKAEVINEDTGARLKHCLDELVQDTDASLAVLVNMSGAVIAQSGDSEQVVPLGALLSGYFAAAQEVAHLLGESEFQMLALEGAHQHCYVVHLYNDRLLFATFSVSTRKPSIERYLRVCAATLNGIR